MENAQRTIWQKLASCTTGRPEDRRNNWIATGLLLLWAVSYVGASLLIGKAALPASLSYLVAAVPVAISILAMAAYARFILRADELLRKVQLEALAFGFAGGFVATFTFDLAEELGLGSVDVSAPMMVMIVCWVIGVVVATRRYA